MNPEIIFDSVLCPPKTNKGSHELEMEDDGSITIHDPKADTNMTIDALTVVEICRLRRDFQTDYLERRQQERIARARVIPLPNHRRFTQEQMRRIRATRIPLDDEFIPSDDDTEREE